MLYCESCMRLVEGARCSECRHKTREVREDDPCLAAELTGVFAGILADILRQEGIPFMQRGQMGAWMTAIIGSGMDVTEFYVPYNRLSQAMGLAGWLSGADGTEIPENSESV